MRNDHTTVRYGTVLPLSDTERICRCSTLGQLCRLDGTGQVVLRAVNPVQFEFDQCPVDQRRTIRFVGDAEIAPGAVLYTDCCGG